MYRGLWLAEPILQQLSQSRWRHIMPTYVGIFQHLNKLSCMSASANVGIFVSILKLCVLTYMSAYFPLQEEYVGISMCRHLCHHLNMLAYMSASEYVGIVERADISTCWHKYIYLYIYIYIYTYICIYIYKPASWCVGISVGIWPAQEQICRHICQHIEMSAHSTRGKNYTNINVSTFVLVLANMLTCRIADIYVDTSRCWHMPTHWDVCTFY